MKRYEKLVLEAEKGMTFETSEGTNGELPAVSAGEYAEVLSVYTDKTGKKAIVPPGWTVSGVSKENNIWGKDVSLVIYRIPQGKEFDWADKAHVDFLKRAYDQLVWVPVGQLEANGTLDGVSFTEKFGRRKYRNYVFSEDNFHEEFTDELALQLESVKKYGGFYISRYDISRSATGRSQSVKGAIPWVRINFEDAKKVASTIENNATLKSHLTFGAEYDSILEWFIKSNARTRSEITEDSKKWGNHWDTENSPKALVKTGSREEWCTNNIYDFAGNVDEWTQETQVWIMKLQRVTRGYSFIIHYKCPVADRDFKKPSSGYINTGFRAALYIK